MLRTKNGGRRPPATGDHIIRSVFDGRIKRRNCSSRAIPPFPTVFSKNLYCRHVKSSVVWERVDAIESMKPARIAQLDRTLDLKTRRCGFDSRAGQPNKYYFLSDETLNGSPV